MRAIRRMRLFSRKTGSASLRAGWNGTGRRAAPLRSAPMGAISICPICACAPCTQNWKARAQHALTLNTAGRLLNQPLELQMSARGGLTETRAGMGWAGTLSQLESRGWIAAQLKAPMTVRAGPHMLILG